MRGEVGRKLVSSSDLDVPNSGAMGIGAGITMGSGVGAGVGGSGSGVARIDSFRGHGGVGVGLEGMGAGNQGPLQRYTDSVNPLVAAGQQQGAAYSNIGNADVVGV